MTSSVSNRDEGNTLPPPAPFGDVYGGSLSKAGGRRFGSYVRPQEHIAMYRWYHNNTGNLRNIDFGDCRLIRSRR